MSRIFFKFTKVPTVGKVIVKDKLIIAVCAWTALYDTKYLIYLNKNLEQESLDLHRFNISYQSSSNCRYMCKYWLTTVQWAHRILNTLEGDHNLLLQKPDSWIKLLLLSYLVDKHGWTQTVVRLLCSFLSRSFFSYSSSFFFTETTFVAL